MKLNKKRSPHSLRKMDQGGKVEKKEVTPSVDRDRTCLDSTRSCTRTPGSRTR